MARKIRLNTMHDGEVAVDWGAVTLAQEIGDDETSGTRLCFGPPGDEMNTAIVRETVDEIEDLHDAANPPEGGKGLDPQLVLSVLTTVIAEASVADRRVSEMADALLRARVEIGDEGTRALTLIRDMTKLVRSSRVVF